MRVSDYDGVVEAWKVELALRRAKRKGFRRHDLEDAMQMLVLVMLDFKYDPARANGLSEKQALSGLIDRRLIDAVRNNRRHDCQVSDENIDKKVDPRSNSHEIRAELSEAITKFDSVDRTIYEGLGNGLTIQELAEQMNCGWHTIMRRVENIRDILRERGLEEGIPA